MVEVYPHAEKVYVRLDRKMRERIRSRLEALEAMEHPNRTPQVAQLTGKLRGFYRFRVGDYRVIFEMFPERRVIAVYAIVHRSRAYRSTDI